MRVDLFWVPVAIVSTLSAPAQAKIYMSIEGAQQAIFPGVTLTPRFTELDQNQYNAVVDESQSEPYGRKVRAWRSPAGDWFVLDQVRGKDDWITYAVGINARGIVVRIEILECLDEYDGITNPAWRAYFQGARHRFSNSQVPIISGSTLSSEQIAAGVRRVLATVALVLEPSLRGKAL